MAYPATDIAQVIAGEFIDTPEWNVLVDALNFQAKRPACRVYHNVDQANANGSGAAIVFNSERYDTDSMHDTVTNNGRITFNTAGLYVVTLSVAITSNATGTRNLSITHSTGGVIADRSDGANPSDATRLVVATVYKMAAATYVTCALYQTSGISLNVLSSASNSPEFSAVWVGRG